MNTNSASSLVATRDGIVRFTYYPDAALREVAYKHALLGMVSDRGLIINRLRARLLRVDGPVLIELLRDLHDAAVRHGVDDAVELTADE